MAEGIFLSSPSLLCGTEVTRGHLLPLHFHFVYICVLLSGRNVLCIPDRDNEIHSGQAEWGWWVRRPGQPKSRPRLCTGRAQRSHIVAIHCHSQDSASCSLLPLPPPDPFSSPPSGSRGNQSELRKMQLIILGLAQTLSHQGFSHQIGLINVLTSAYLW